MKINLNQVKLLMTDIERSIAFYQAIGLRLIVQSLPKYARFECPAGDTTFSIHVTDGDLTPGNAWVYFETDELDGLVTKLVNAGLVFEEMPENKPWLWREARLKDPDGHTIILYHAGENRKNPPWRLS